MVNDLVSVSLSGSLAVYTFSACSCKSLHTDKAGHFWCCTGAVYCAVLRFDKRGSK